MTHAPFHNLKIHKGNVDSENRQNWSCWHMRKKCFWMLFLFRLGSPEPRLSEQGHRRAACWFMNFPAAKHRVALVKNATIVWTKGWRFHLNLHISAIWSRTARAHQHREWCDRAFYQTKQGKKTADSLKKKKIVLCQQNQIIEAKLILADSADRFRLDQNELLPWRLLLHLTHLPAMWKSRNVLPQRFWKVWIPKCSKMYPNILESPEMWIHSSNCQDYFAKDLISRCDHFCPVGRF